MKTFRALFVLLFITGSYSVANATIYTVNNNQNLPNTPGQYTNVTAAISAASSGDTILIAGSATAYSGFNISKKLVILGPGYNPDKQNPLPATFNASIYFTTAAASGSTIMGINCSYIYNASGFTLSNVTIRRNWVGGIYLAYDSTSNILIAENMVLYYVYLYTSSKDSIKNNVFYEGAYLQELNTTSHSYNLPVYIYNNLFLNGNYSTPLKSSSLSIAIYSRNAVISNNIFYNVFPMDTSGKNTKTSGYVNNTFNNNLEYSGATIRNLPDTNNIGSGNLNNVDPKFIAILSSSTNPYLDFNVDNLRLKSGSPAHNAGTDHTDIGPTGGRYPIYVSTNRYLTGEPTIPEIKQINYIGPSSVSPGKTIKIQIKATKIN